MNCPHSVLNSGGKHLEKTIQNTKQKKSNPAPIPIKVNIFKFQLIIDFQLEQNIQAA
jgi:hypothetical protein